MLRVPTARQSFTPQLQHTQEQPSPERRKNQVEPDHEAIDCGGRRDIFINRRVCPLFTAAVQTTGATLQPGNGTSFESRTGERISAPHVGPPRGEQKEPEKSRATLYWVGIGL